MLKNIGRFTSRLSIFITVVFFFHIALLKHMGFYPFENLIIQAYTSNFLLAVFIFSILSLLQKKYNDQLGFLFMAGSLLKFAVFFIFFYPGFREDGSISRLEFFAFFIPYLVCLFMETLMVARILNATMK